MILLLCSLLWASPSESWTRASEAAAQGDYVAAAAQYRELLQQGVVHENVYYNLGNSLYRQNRLGEAVLAWRRAAVLAPRDPDVQANLAFARRKLRDDLRPVDSSPWFAPWQAFLSVGEGCYLGAGLLGVGLVIFGLRRRLPGTPEAPAALLAAFGALVWGAAIYQDQRTDAGVVLAEEVTVSSELSGGVELFRLHLGAEVELGERVGGYCLVRLPDGRKGWVLEDKLGSVDPSAAFPAGANPATPG